MSTRVTMAVALGLTLWSWAHAASETPPVHNLGDALRALEQVRERHRLWPQENRGPKPALDSIVPGEEFDRRAREVLRESQALRQIWETPVLPRLLQAELDRMAAQSQDPSRLAEYFAALGGDPRGAAEALARPALVDRWIRDRYASDPGLHREERERAEALLACGAAVTRPMVYLLDSAPPVEGAQRLSPEAFETLRRRSPRPGGPPALVESTEAFLVVWTREAGEGRLVVDQIEVPKRPFEAWWEETRAQFDGRGELEGDQSYSFRMPPAQTTGISGCKVWDDPLKINGFPGALANAKAVWTGSEMLVWGGFSPTVYRFTPATDSWTASAASANIPTPRANHTIVWTGSAMVVFGGLNGSSAYLADGGRYSPASDSWSPISTASPSPQPRAYHTAVWTGSRMVVWGGRNYGGDLYDGGQYDPVQDVWTATATTGPVPQARAYHTAVWTGTEMILWGGLSGSTPLNSWGRYTPGTDSWTSISYAGWVPGARYQHTSVWTGSCMVIWGGSNGSTAQAAGGRFYPALNQWVPVSATSEPAARYSHAALWAPELGRMLIWGGWGSAALGDGSRYDPVGDGWQAMASGGAPAARQTFAAAWTGAEMVLWGGSTGSATLNSGARYNPTDNTWTSMTPGLPAGRYAHSAVWTGSEMLVWGGYGELGTPVRTGSAYDPATGTWAPLPVTASTPAGCASFTTVWTGTEMIVWGGTDGTNVFNTGGAYNPATHAWRATSTGSNVPSIRRWHTAVWTGTEMVVWGGAINPRDSWLDTGGRYAPSSDTWTPTSTVNAPMARDEHTAVWTGTEMLIWGGWGISWATVGGAYNPASDTWRTMATTNGPGGRIYHKAVWDGSRMLICGGWNGSNATVGPITGWRYTPASDSWSAMASDPNVYECRFGIAVWTGTEMFYRCGEYMFCAGWTCPWYKSRTGGLYNPATNAWTALDGYAANALNDRTYFTAVWTGSAVLLWGGIGSSVSYSQDGAIYAVSAPASPADGLRAGRSTAVDLDWSDSAGATGYSVKRCDATAGPCTPTAPIGSPAASALSDADALAPGNVAKSYWYTVEAMNACGTAP